MTYTERVWDSFSRKVIALYEDGKNEEEIAEILDTSQMIVEKVVDDYNQSDDA